MNEYINIFFMLIMSVTGILIAINNISPYKLKIKDNVIMIISLVSAYVFVEYFFPDFATIVLYFIPMLFILKKSRKFLSSVFIDIFACVLIIIVDNLVSSIFYLTIGVNESSNNAQYWITCFTILVVLYGVTKFVGNLYSEYKIFIYKNLKSKYFILIYTMIIVTFGVFYYSINWSKYLDTTYNIVINSIIELIYGLIMIVTCISLLVAVRKEEKIKYEQAELENLREYTNNLEDVYTEMRKFRHDYINVISSMSAFIEEKDMDGLKEYFNDNIYPLNSRMDKNNYKLGLLKNILMQEVKGVISTKVIRAQELGIDVIIDIVDVIDNIKMDKVDLIRVLGIILDNAIEAAENSDAKIINIAIIKKEKSVVIVITNTYGGDILPVSKMFKAGVSTKGENRGLGLNNLKEIIGRYENVCLDTYIENNIFIQEITVCNDNKF
ncbi:two-component system, AgrA family, sensor histidine kinase AgrC [Clostridium sp. DSM 8431]|uniref:GHKL domain-containing protein n=1 Tax=Clostridium sp. DSM 8431 TaxID=1761781 RepID=UPI0008F15EEC|nr:GHKL domain-containing protein [Clostridium sp. DSM 8431]SFU39969.1 two-component system, AgrA family, sensor histidine kinase AgrC [Clostridium sp. DSM 8431]